MVAIPEIENHVIFLLYRILPAVVVRSHRPIDI